MKPVLLQLGYDPEFAKNGKEAFEILEKEEFPLNFNGVKIARDRRH